MRMKMDLGGASYLLDPAAISAIRYRAEYGDSIINHLAACQTVEEREGRLLRMCHCMIPEADRPELLDFAKRARQDKDFLTKAITARNALLVPDPRWDGHKGGDGDVFDEYQVIALLGTAQVEQQWVYELPIMHLIAVIGRACDSQNPDKKAYKEMDSDEMALMYPGARKEGAHG